MPNFERKTRPCVEDKTIFIESHEIDVFVIKNSVDVSYYLIESYADKNYISKGVHNAITKDKI